MKMIRRSLLLVIFMWHTHVETLSEIVSCNNMYYFSDNNNVKKFRMDILMQTLGCIFSEKKSSYNFRGPLCVLKDLAIVQSSQQYANNNILLVYIHTCPLAHFHSCQ
jgi:hypothetical protein